MEKLDRVYHPGNVEWEAGKWEPVFCHAVIDDKGELHMTGVVGPKKNGDACSCGQCQDLLQTEILRPAPGWTPELVDRLCAVWERWHLNHMRPYCEHQYEEGAYKKQLTVVTYRLAREMLRAQNKEKEEAVTRLMQGEVVEWQDDVRALMALQWEVKTGDNIPPHILQACYKEEKRETQPAGHTLRKEHPEGILSEPCAVCGYKYGSAWLKEELPEDVRAFLLGLPETDVAPAWI